MENRIFDKKHVIISRICESEEDQGFKKKILTRFYWILILEKMADHITHYTSR